MKPTPFRSLAYTFLLVFLSSAAPHFLQAQHTFSIVAVDPVTGEVGSAGATCLTSADCGGCGGAVIISQMTPGKGAINAQATVCIPNTNANNGNIQIAIKRTAPMVLDYVLSNDGCQFGDTSNRQYGIATLDTNGLPDAVAFTGSNAMSYAGHHTGPTYAVQGNILLGPQIVDSMEARFNATNGPLCEKLMAALQGANVPGADTRCLNNGISSESSFIRVARPSDNFTFWLDIRVESTLPGVDPIDSLQVLFDQFKTLNGVENSLQKEIKAYPNPTNGDFKVDFREFGNTLYDVRIYNTAGSLILSSQRLPNQDLFTVRKSDLGSSGMYLFTAQSPETSQRLSLKVLVK